MRKKTNWKKNIEKKKIGRNQKLSCEVNSNSHKWKWFFQHRKINQFSIICIFRIYSFDLNFLLTEFFYENGISMRKKIHRTEKVHLNQKIQYFFLIQNKFFNWNGIRWLKSLFYLQYKTSQKYVLFFLKNSKRNILWKT